MATSSLRGEPSHHLLKDALPASAYDTVWVFYGKRGFDHRVGHFRPLRIMA